MSRIGQPLFRSEEEIPRSQSVVVKFADGAGVKAAAKAPGFEFENTFLRPDVLAEKGLDRAAIEHTVKSATALVDVDRMQVVPVFDRPPEVLFAEALAAEKALDGLLPDPNLYASVRVKNARAEELESLAAGLQALDAVELAYVQPIPFEAAVDVAPPTAQLGVPGYHEPAPDGIDARYAWRIPGGRGLGVRIIDVEGAWTLDHEDLPAVFYNGAPLVNPFDWFTEDHGTAVLGQLAAAENAYGFVGLVPEAQVGVCTWADLFGGGVAGALDRAAARLSPGDVLLIEVHFPGPTTRTLEDYNMQRGFVPVEWVQAEFDAIRRISARGVIVVEAAGNGAENLDDPLYERRFDRSMRDSGAIMVGAGTPRGRMPEWFTNHGSRVDVHGWGSGVQTCGYGEGGLRFNGDDKRQWYTPDFRGTSSASPIVAAAAASVQGASLAGGLGLRTPGQMRDILRATGTGQAADARQIGPLPNLRAALDRLGLREPAPNDWPTLAGPLLSAPAVESNRDGRMEVVGIVGDGSLFHISQTAPSNGWARWSPFPERLPGVQLRGTPAIVRNFDGRLEIFALGSDMAIWHIWQTRPDNGWSGWESLGGRCTSSPAVEINHDGRLDIFARWEDDSLHRNWQRFVNWGWSGWHGMGGGLVGAPGAGHNADRRIEVFVRGTDGLLYQIVQRSPGDDWTGYVPTGVRIAGDPVLGHTGQGPATRMELFAAGPDGSVVHRWQTAPNDGWNTNRGFGEGQRLAPGSRPAVRADPSGLLHVFVRLENGQVAMRHHTDRAPWWTPWRDLGGSLVSDPAAGVNADGRLEVLARGSGGMLNHRWAPFG